MKMQEEDSAVQYVEIVLDKEQADKTLRVSWH
jgi:hypothetical protein